ncbi:lysosome membrane protein 2-like [Oratosquilla oratoria]|uniref:lysosome membrane protein 2-like n=1 Tax=Oratosquilla oratoria TaxID=337810 RepID=UPI003F76455B
MAMVAVCGVVGVLLVASGVTLMMTFPAIFDKMLKNKLVLREGAPMMKNYMETPIPIYMQFYIFNLTNPDEVLRGSKPVLDQKGPYTYEQKRRKFGLDFDTEQGTLSFKQNKTYFFRPDLSQGNMEDDRITTINAVMISLGSRMEKLNESDQFLFELLFWRFRTTVFITKTVGELLFKGYDEPLLSEISKYTKDPMHLSGKFGFFYMRNNSNDGVYKVFSGQLGMDNYQNIVEWRGMSKLDFWKNEYCNSINGTEGSQYPPGLSRSRNLKIYTSELCRTIVAEYEKDVHHGDITLYRYVLPDWLLADTEENKCYCHDDFTCRASMINISPCKKGSPVIMSTPHFYQGDTVDIEDKIGLNPTKEEHETYLDIEPNTGVMMRAAKRIQINMPLRKYGRIPAFKQVPDLIYPIIWINESAVVPVERANALNQTLTLPILLVPIASWVLIGLGILLIVIGVIKYIRVKHIATRDKNISPIPDGKHSQAFSSIKDHDPTDI